jgi:Zn-dependent peptidase ImmA (M78 family)
MMMLPVNRALQAEKVAEAFAHEFLEDHYGKEIFTGALIERVLEEKATVIYQYVEDPNYFGAAVSHKVGEHFIVLNTFHSLRTRYFTAAHELWHLAEVSKMQDEGFDHERAADRFAAAIMLPKHSVKELWGKFKKQYGTDQAVIHIADLAAVPYITVVRRLKELDIITNGLSSVTEEDWIQKRKEFDLPETALDQPHPWVRFTAYEKIVDKGIHQGLLDPLVGANKLAKIAPEQAQKWHEKVRTIIQEDHDDA